MMQRIFAHHLYISTPAKELQAATGKAQRLSRILIRTSHALGPWFLLASIGVLIALFHWKALFFVPVFAIGYFMFSVQSVKNGSLPLPGILVILSLILNLFPEAPRLVSAFLLLFSCALFMNRFSWWYAEKCLQANPSLESLFEQADQKSPRKVEDAEVIEID